jgi:3-(3-hydroxy-phenyl)propionate hydroxylase
MTGMTASMARPMSEHQVVVAGGGPTGMMVAAELALAGVDVAIVERRATQELDGSRAGGLHARTIEVLEQRGVAERFVSAGQAHSVHGFAMIPMDISDLASRHSYVLALPQSRFEPILAGWVEELGVPTLRGLEVAGCTEDGDRVVVELSDGSSVAATFLVGCDGGRSVVRRAAGIDFNGSDPTMGWMIAEVEMDEEPQLGMRQDAVGSHGITRMAEGEPIRILITEADPPGPAEPTVDDLRDALVRLWGTAFGLRRAHWISRFSDVTRQAVSYRAGRVLLAGDAAHIHPPTGGQGMNTGIQDAVNLGWKLGQVVRGTSPDGLLDTYHAERHPVGASVLHNTLAQVALSRRDDRSQAVRDTMTDLLRMDEPRRHVAGMLTGLDIRYDLGEGHPLLGRRLPDLDLETPDGPTRAYTLLHAARPLLLCLGGSDRFDLSPWSDRVRLVEATYEGAWELPVLGEVPPPGAVLVRPDGYVAWTGALADPGLPQALERWFGPAVA